MKIAIITGASGGIGWEIAKRLDGEHLEKMLLLGRNEEKLNQLKSELSTEAKILPIDFSSPDFTSQITSHLTEETEIAYLVCCAGLGYNGAFETLTEKEIASVISVNCKSTTLCIHACLPYMKEGAHIVTLGSGAGFLPQPYFAVYASSKSYLLSFSRALATELKSRKITVTCSCPGPVDTRFFADLKNVKEYKKKFLISPQKVAERVVKKAKKGKFLDTPSFSMKLVHLCSKIVPTSLILKFYH